MTGIGNDYQIASLSNYFVIGNDGSSNSYGSINWEKLVKFNSSTDLDTQVKLDL